MALNGKDLVQMQSAANSVENAAKALRSKVIDSINTANQALHAAGGVALSLDNSQPIQTLVRDARARKSEQKIDWIAAYQMRTLSFLMTAITLVEVNSEHSNANKTLEQLNTLLPEITQPSLWTPEEKAKENFAAYVEKMSATLKEINVAEKSFYYANGWVSVDLPPQIIETKSRINGTDYIIRSEPICELTPAIEAEFKRILLSDKTQWPTWYKVLPDDTKKLCQYYAKKIVNGELHQLTPGLRGLIPGLKNAYKTTLIRERENEELLSFYHTATAPMGSESLDEAENIRLTQLNFLAMQEGAEDDVVSYSTLVSRHGDDIQAAVHQAKAVKSQVKNFVGVEGEEAPKRPELIDHIINNISHLAARLMQKTGGHFYHSNVCLNGARRFERSKVDGLEKVLDFIETKLKRHPDADLLDSLKKARQEVEDLGSKTKQGQALFHGDEEMRAYKSLSAFVKLVHNYNKRADINEGARVRWYFGCASGQNRTQALGYSLIYQAIHEDQVNNVQKRPLNELEEAEIATRLAEDGHFNYINGPYDWKFGIRSKSAGSFAKSLFRQIQTMILSLADTKRPGDVLFAPPTADNFFAELNENSPFSIEKLSSIWDKYVYGKNGIALNDEELFAVLDGLRELDQRYQMYGISDNIYAKFLQLAFRDEYLTFFFCQEDNKYKEVFGFIRTLDRGQKKLEPQQLVGYIQSFFKKLNSIEGAPFSAEDAYELLGVIYPDLKTVIEDAYQKRGRVESRAEEADSEREEKEAYNENSEHQDEKNLIDIKRQIVLPGDLIEAKQLVAKESRFISSLLADGKMDLAYDFAVALADSALSIKAVQDNGALRGALSELKDQVLLLPQQQNNPKNKAYATKALLLVSEEVLNCAQYVSQPNQADGKNKEYKSRITPEKMQDIVGTPKDKRGLLSTWRDRILGVARTIKTICEVLNPLRLLSGSNESQHSPASPYRDNLLKCAADYNEAAYKATAQLIDRGAKFLEGAEAEAAIAAATGKTPLHCAIIESPHEIQIIKQLIENGANVNAKDKKAKTPLHYAIPDSNGLVALLGENGADVDAKDRYGKTPLHYAVQYGDMNAVQILIKEGANADTCDIQDKTPRDYAMELGNKDICNLLGALISPKVDLKPERQLMGEPVERSADLDVPQVGEPIPNVEPEGLLNKESAGQMENRLIEDAQRQLEVHRENTKDVPQASQFENVVLKPSQPSANLYRFLNSESVSKSAAAVIQQANQLKT